MKTIQVELPDSAFSALRKEPNEFVQEMRIAAVKWWELEPVSQEKAAEISGLNRSEFIGMLARYQAIFLIFVRQE
ncbi:MAG: UPF0175 family protein [Cyanobacteria bacterium P01_D01_bin.105]